MESLPEAGHGPVRRECLLSVTGVLSILTDIFQLDVLIDLDCEKLRNLLRPGRGYQHIGPVEALFLKHLAIQVKLLGPAKIRSRRGKGLIQRYAPSRFGG